jgi:capsular polysaccharide biosynthesis protein
MEEIDLKELFDYLKGKIIWIILAVFFAVIVGNVYTIITRVPMYKTNVSLVLVSEKNGDGNEVYNSSEQQLNKNLVGTYSEIAKSKTVLNKVIKNLDLDISYTELKNRIEVTSVENTEIINIYVSDKNPKMATITANEIANVFVTEVNNFYKLNNVNILDEATNVKTPYNVNYVKDNRIYVLIGIVVSLGVLFIIFYFDTSIKTSEEIEKKLGLTVIGSVPKARKE